MWTAAMLLAAMALPQQPSGYTYEVLNGNETESRTKIAYSQGLAVRSVQDGVNVTKRCDSKMTYAVRFGDSCMANPFPSGSTCEEALVELDVLGEAYASPQGYTLAATTECPEPPAGLNLPRTARCDVYTPPVRGSIRLSSFNFAAGSSTPLFSRSCDDEYRCHVIGFGSYRAGRPAAEALQPDAGCRGAA